MFRRRWKSSHPKRGYALISEQAHSRIPYRSAKSPQLPLRRECVQQNQASRCNSLSGRRASDRLHPCSRCLPDRGCRARRMADYRYRIPPCSGSRLSRRCERLSQRGHRNRNTLSSDYCRLTSNHPRCRCGCPDLGHRFQTSPCLLRRRRRTYNKPPWMYKSHRMPYTLPPLPPDYKRAQQDPLCHCRCYIHANDWRNLYSNPISSCVYIRRGQQC